MNRDPSRDAMSNETGFVSTRGRTQKTSFPEAMMLGLAPDGGLFVPEVVPTVEFGSLDDRSYSMFAAYVLSSFIEDHAIRSRLKDICGAAFNFDVPIVQLSGGSWTGCHVLELFHGPTLSFKDFGARFMARALTHAGDYSSGMLTVLVATSGDTGSAVADGFAGQNNVNVVLLYPAGQVSPIQERQLIVRRDGVHVFRVSGTFDDCQRLVKGAFSGQFQGRLQLTSANSINIGRLLPQMVYYAWAKRRLNELSTFSVPSGNLGNLTAGVLAHLAGLRVRRFIASHNGNSFFPEYLSDPDAAFRPSIQTLSNAMDVGAPSNFERLSYLLERSEMTRLIRGYSIDDDDTTNAIREVYESTGYVADPHTAVGLRGLARYRSANGEGDGVVLATAHPAKFADTVRRAIGIKPAVPEPLARLADADLHVADLPVSQEALNEVIRSLALRA